MMHHPPRFSFATTLILLFWVVQSDAATIVVTAQINQTGCDLAEAINSANSNTLVGGCTAAGIFGDDQILLSPSIATYNLPGVNNAAAYWGSAGLPLITSKIEILGLTTKLTTIARDSIDFFRIFIVYGGNLTLQNVRLTNGKLSQYHGGAIFVEQNGQSAPHIPAYLTLRNVQIDNSQAVDGGALYASSGAHVKIFQSSLVGNQATGVGNANGIGGAIRAFNPFDRNTLSIYDSTFADNSALMAGGAISFGSKASTLNIFNTTVVRNFANNNGAGLALYSGTAADANSINITNSILSGNTATGGVDEISVSGGTETDIAARIKFYASIIGDSSKTLLGAVNTLTISNIDNIYATSDATIPYPISSIVENGVFETARGMTVIRLPEASPAIDSASRFRVSGTSPLLFYTPGCAGEIAQLSGSPPPYRPDQQGTARPLGPECDIGAIEFDLGTEVCYIGSAENDNVFAFCL